MWTGMMSKFLIPTLILGSLSSGGYGVFQLVNKKEKESSLKIESTSPIIKKIYEDDSLNKFQENKQELIEEVKDTPKEENLVSFSVQVEENVKVSPIESSSEKEEIEEKVESELEKNKRLEEEKKQKYDSERKSNNTWLETVWIQRSGDGRGAQEKSCTLLIKGQERKIPNIMTESDEGDNEKTCYDDQTSDWISDKDLGDYGEGLWVRGEEQEVVELLRDNWDELLRPSNFVNKNLHKPSSSPKELLEEVKKTCEVTQSLDKLTEVVCLTKK